MVMSAGTQVGKIVLSTSPIRPMNFIKILASFKLETIMIFLGLCFSQMFIQFYSISHLETVVLSIQSLANGNNIGSNSYKFAQAIENLETLNLLKCSRVYYGKELSAFTDNSFKGSCDSNFVQLQGIPFNTTIEANSGQTWRLESIAVYNIETRTMFWLVRLLSSFLFLGLVKYMKSRLHKLEIQKKNEYARIEGMVSLAMQVAHDIRSPIMALEAALSNDNGLSTDRRKLIEQASIRIKNIAEDLLSKTRQPIISIPAAATQYLQKEQDNEYPIMNLNNGIRLIIIEKNTSFLAGKIEMDQVDESIYINADINKFRCVLSNLIQNAIEAVSECINPRIQVSVRKYSSQVQISIIDNGKGISSDLLSKVGMEGFTFGKVDGNGLGVHFAKKMVRQWGGEMTISSQIENGTMVTMTFPYIQHSASVFASR
jgi:signal transduction histidine kinase